MIYIFYKMNWLYFLYVYIQGVTGSIKNQNQENFKS